MLVPVFTLIYIFIQIWTTKAQPCTISRDQIGISKSLRFTCPFGYGFDPAIPNEYLHNPSQFGLIQFQYNTYTAIPAEKLCLFTNVFHVDLSFNNIKTIKNGLNKLKCLRGLIELDLSHNQIQSDLVYEDFSDEFSINIEYLDLSYNSIDYLDTNVFLKSKNEARFPRLKYFKINNNQLRSFDLLIPLSLPSERLQFDASYNPIERFLNKYKRSFKENPFFYDVSTSNRTVNLINNKLRSFGDELLNEYGIYSETDLEVFLNRIGNYVMVQKDNSFSCSCPAFASTTVSMFKQLDQLDKTLAIYKLSCSSFQERQFVLNYSCGKLDSIFVDYKYKLNTYYTNLIKENINMNPLFTKIFEQQRLHGFNTWSVVPDLIDDAPDQALLVKWEEAIADFGNKVTPSQAAREPNISWEAETTAYYTLTMIDLDPLGRFDPGLRGILHWLVVNIPANNLELGETRAEYIGLGPANDASFHRYAFLVFKQEGIQDFSEQPYIKNNTTLNRSSFNIRSFAQKYKLSGPLFGNFLVTRWDSFVPTLWKQIGLID